MDVLIQQAQRGTLKAIRQYTDSHYEAIQARLDEDAADALYADFEVAIQTTKGQRQRAIACYRVVKEWESRLGMLEEEI